MNGDDIHRIGGGAVENLRLKPREATLSPPGISVLKCPTPADAARQIRTEFPQAVELHSAARVIGSASVARIRAAGFDVVPAPTRRLSNHCRITHPDGAAGFTDENLERLSQAFTNTSGH